MSIDQAILHGINGFARESAVVDHAMNYLVRSPIFKGVVSMMILWGVWFRHRDEGRDWAHARLVAAVLVCCVAIVIGRGLALLMPFRERPMHTEDLGVILPIGVRMDELEGWSSMPSDHAVLYFAFATALFAVSRTWGVIALLHALLIISLPRVFTGMHFPSDIAVGALVGVAVALLLGRPTAMLVGRVGLIRLEHTRPALFYALMFAVTFQIATMFDSIRGFISGVVNTFH